MFNVSFTGIPSTIATIERRKGLMQSGPYDITLETAVKIAKLAKRKVPKDTGLLRQNIRIAIMADWRGKKVSINNSLIARGKRQREAKARIKTKVSVRRLHKWINNVSNPSSVKASIYAPPPYARIRDIKGGIGKPAGYLTNTARLYKIIYIRKLNLMVKRVGRM